MKPKVMFYCQHVLGMGHMVRSREIVKGLREFEVTFLNGGEPVDGFAFPQGVRVEQLTPIRGDVAFQGIDATEAVKQERRSRLLALLDEIDPEAIVIEMFPFGRRKFAFELLPLLEAIAARGRRTQVICSVRDILVGKRDQRRHEEQACRILNAHFDRILVHSDRQFQELGETFWLADQLTCPVEYTGFVTETLGQAGPREEAGNEEPKIVASAGGGRVGYQLLEATVAASLRLQQRVRHTLQVFTGPYLPDDEYALLQRQAAGADWIQIERFALDFSQRLQEADLLVSMAGYNTCMNVLTTGIKALVHPFTGNENQEQTIRAQKLEQLGWMGVVKESELNAEHLAARMEALLATPVAANRPQLQLDGVKNTARILAEVIARVPSHV